MCCETTALGLQWLKNSGYGSDPHQGSRVIGRGEPVTTEKPKSTLVSLSLPIGSPDICNAELVPNGGGGNRKY
jgi:hypothetical protein